MSRPASVQAETVLNSFAEFMSKLMIDQYQQHLAELALTLPQAQVLRILKGSSRLTGQLAEELRISAPAMTQLTDRLLRKGLIERRAATNDRRCVIVALSQRGERLVDQFCERRREIFSSALALLSDVEQEQVGEALGMMIKALEGQQSISANGHGVFSHQKEGKLLEHL
ncbi:MarR family transcriptional regulator [soil metagenome]